MRIYKYEVTTDFTLELPVGYEVLSVADQYNVAQMWIKVDEKETNTLDVRFMAFGTGHSIDPELNLKFIGTFPTVNGMLIFHLFEVLE